MTGEKYYVFAKHKVRDKNYKVVKYEEDRCVVGLPYMKTSLEAYRLSSEQALEAEEILKKRDYEVLILSYKGLNDHIDLDKVILDEELKSIVSKGK